MLFNIMITLIVLSCLSYTGYWWTPGAGANAWRGPFTGLSLVLLVVWLIWELIQLGAIHP